MVSGKSNSVLMIAGASRPTITLPISRSPEHFPSKGQTGVSVLSWQKKRMLEEPNVGKASCRAPAFYQCQEIHFVISLQEGFCPILLLFPLPPTKISRGISFPK